MKRFLICLALFFCGLASGAPLVFEDDFSDTTLRIDFFQTGDASQTLTTIDELYEQGIWAGNPRALIDSLNRGAYYVKIVDINTNRVIYARGFSTIFEEYRAQRLIQCAGHTALPAQRRQPDHA